MIKQYLHILFLKLADKTKLNDHTHEPPLIKISDLELNYSLYKKAMDDLFVQLSQHQVQEILIQYNSSDQGTLQESVIENPRQSISVNYKTAKKQYYFLSSSQARHKNERLLCHVLQFLMDV